MKRNPATRSDRPAPCFSGVVRRSIMGAWCLIILFAGLVGSAHAGDAVVPPPATTKATNSIGTRAVTEAELLTLLTTTLQNEYVKDRGELELSLTQAWKPPTLPDEALTLKILELPTAGVTSAFIVRFQLCSPEKTLGTWQATLQAHVWHDAWVAHSTLRRGDPINQADIARERCDMLKVRDALAEFSADDSDLELAQMVPAGAPLVERMVKPRVVIHRGQMASARLEDGALTITIKVEALEDGAPGQMIRARNIVSRRDVRGRVVDSQTISVSL